ncbi:hypothetical protein [Epilithonimonas mollis]|uniref:Uncharacterized protein n=1 Tax=Epilithonimonas mollis TaxID=216903 RepID=A0A1M6MYY3_9FLAO|nr:hypothetical protein [Epilithonimonas mollis]SHJ88691.1 hypothetical protein SAMN05444371_0061 [Epilithonimonas mollis]
MIFDKNFLKSSGEDGFFIFQEDQGNSSFVNPYNDNPYMISSLQKLKNRISCKKKQSVIDSCLDDYKDQIVEHPQMNHVFDNDLQPQPNSFAAYAKSSYQKVLKDLEHLQNLIDQLGVNEVRI